MDLGGIANSALETTSNLTNTAKEYMNYAIIVANGDNLIDGADNITIHEITTEGLDLSIEATDEPIATRQYLRQHSVPHPMEFTISGYVYDRELKTTNIELANEILANQLGSVNAFLPNKLTGTALKLADATLQKYQQLRGYASKVVGGTDSVLGLIKKIRGNEVKGETKTFQVAKELEKLAKLCVVVDVNILGVKRQNVYISSLHIDRETAHTKEKIGISINFKEVPIVNDESILCNTAKIQRAKNTNLGKVAGKKMTTDEVKEKKNSILFSVFN